VLTHPRLWPAASFGLLVEAKLSFCPSAEAQLRFYIPLARLLFPGLEFRLLAACHYWSAEGADVEPIDCPLRAPSGFSWWHWRM
jgi:hypothetical protein